MNLPRFGVQKPVPVNLLMAAIILAGIYSAITITREFFPDIDPNMALVSLPYPGAAPEEVEESLALKVEDAIAELDEVDELRTNLAEGGGGITVKFKANVFVDKAIDEVERAVDALTDLPSEAESIQTVTFEPKLPVIMVSLFGDEDEERFKRAVNEVRDDLMSLPSMGQVLLSGVRDYEVRVDVSYPALLEHGISLPEVSNRIHAWMSDVPGGSVRSEAGDISVRTKGVEERAEAIENIVIKADPNGQALRVGDIATVRQHYVDQQLIRRFNGSPAVSLTVFKTGSQDAVEMAEMVRAYVDGRRRDPFVATAVETTFGSKRKTAYELGLSRQTPLPGELATHSDLARFIEGRLSLLTRNALWGAILVFATLFLFLNWRVALWVGVGLVTALSGTLLIMSASGITLNLLTMFGLIVVLGLLVDDAIVVAENIQTRHDQGEPALQAAINGTNDVFWPVVATVMTSIVAFLPLRFVRGQIGDLLGALPLVVACALAMSLIESVLILPSHMGHSLKHRDLANQRQSDGHGRTKKSRHPLAFFRRFETWRDSVLHDRVIPRFGRLLSVCLKYRYVSVAIAVATLIGSLGLVAGGHAQFTFLTSSDSETIVVDVRLPIGVSISETDAIVRVIEEAVAAEDQQAAVKTGAPEVKSIGTIIGEKQDLNSGARDVSANHVAQVFVELVPVEQRTRESSAFIDAVRERLDGHIAMAESVVFSEISGGPGGADITFEVMGDDLDRISAAVIDLETSLRAIPGVFDVTDDNYAGQRELQIRLKAGAAALGFTNEDVATQVRGALFGLDAHVFSERREDIDVRVRLDENTRRSLAAVEGMWLVSPAGKAVPLTEIAELVDGSGYATIKRIDRQRAITITADTGEGTNPEQVMAGFPMDDIMARHPGVEIQLGGRQRNFQEAFSTLPLGFLAAMLMVYVILAWLFGSYTQPLAVMLAIPFSCIGVIWGHFIMGYELTFLSLIGFVALSGIVVNDSLILVEFYNGRRRAGVNLRDALVEAGMRRLRPIFLTTVTTVLGLTPLMLEQSFQAKFLIPMAISIAFGLMSATLLILMVLPCIIVIIDDIKAVSYFMWNGRARPEPIVPTGNSLA